jgi:hypothetical protein
MGVVGYFGVGVADLTNRAARRSFDQRGNDLHHSGRAVVGIVPDDQWAGMWRSDGSLSDMVNP